jgi:hypothetical protein
MTVYVVTLEDHCDNSECFVFSTDEKATEFAREQEQRGVWLNVDQYEAAVVDDVSEISQ